VPAARCGPPGSCAHPLAVLLHAAVAVANLMLIDHSHEDAADNPSLDGCRSSSTAAQLRCRRCSSGCTTRSCSWRRWRRTGTSCRYTCTRGWQSSDRTWGRSALPWPAHVGIVPALITLSRLLPESCSLRVACAHRRLQLAGTGCVSYLSRECCPPLQRQVIEVEALRARIDASLHEQHKHLGEQQQQVRRTHTQEGAREATKRVQVRLRNTCK
jgi:hypothetical protein